LLAGGLGFTGLRDMEAALIVELKKSQQRWVLNFLEA
jgi:hypothetical protein